MPRPRFLTPDLTQLQPHGPGRVALPTGEAHHARRVLRLENGAAVELLDGAGRSATGTLVEGSSVDIETVVDHPRPAVSVTVLAPLPKGPRADQMIDQLTQLGVRRFVPLLTRHSQPEPKPTRVEKLRRGIEAALKQSGNPWAMTLGPVTTLSDSFNQPGSRWLADRSNQPVSSPMNDTDHTHAVWVGPEGGWSDAERDAALEAGLQPLALGPYTLRVETAAVIGAARWLRS
ncbi:MAG: RsmE family RNA methyltransferase [Planctomycetota bacterium]